MRHEGTHVHEGCVIAQEIEEVIPELVHKDDNDGMLSVDYVSIIPVLIEAVKSLKLENDILKERLRLVLLEQRSAE
jgi:hypothetical protein